MCDQYAFVHFAIKKNDRSYFFLAQMGSPYEEALEVLKEFADSVEEMKVVSAASKEKSEEVEPEVAITT
jgi:hypothetical protein